MALQKNITIPGTSLVVSNAYLRISEISLIPRISVNIVVSFYVNQSDRENNKSSIKASESFQIKNDDPLFEEFFSTESLDEEGSNIISNSYQFLKTLPDFAEAEDV